MQPTRSTRSMCGSTATREEGVVIFTVDYTLTPENIAWVYETSRAQGFIPFVGSRALDRFMDVWN
jgi:endo-alpha-1,4-polygalactosaminidase (GH114 family)